MHSVVVCLCKQGLNVLTKNRKENKLICIFVVKQTRELINTEKASHKHNKDLNKRSVISMRDVNPTGDTPSDPVFYAQG